MTEKSALFLLEGSKPNELPLSGVVTLFSLQLTILLIALISNAFTSTFIVRHHDRLQIFRRLTLLQCTLCYCVNFVRILLILRLIALPNIGWDWPKNMYFFLTYRLLNILFTTMVFVCEDMVTAMRYLVTFHEDWMENCMNYISWFFFCSGIAIFSGIFCTGSKCSSFALSTSYNFYSLQNILKIMI